MHLPGLSQLEWRYLDSLLELLSGYGDREWSLLGHTSTNNIRALTAPACLYAVITKVSLIYRGQEVLVLLNISLCHRPTGECLGFEAEVLISVLWVSRRADWGMLDSSGGGGHDVVSLTVWFELTVGSRDS